ncbi:Versican core protein [Hondaea fermentalgiana]|uniref:Versican core protein n=1 Tax=Hondaea fermentalgiana TaxID=2315210 RepID=A0A2R5GG44_9STRA|nr:Versican core protein [Hondaea fermentalgiana]|eukprot:GBG29882.1 Versican core protein [Hondaea fermentalgiana]
MFDMAQPRFAPGSICRGSHPELTSHLTFFEAELFNYCTRTVYGYAEVAYRDGNEKFFASSIQRTGNRASYRNFAGEDCDYDKAVAYLYDSGPYHVYDLRSGVAKDLTWRIYWDNVFMCCRKKIYVNDYDYEPVECATVLDRAKECKRKFADDVQKKVSSMWKEVLKGIVAQYYFGPRLGRISIQYLSGYKYATRESAQQACNEYGRKLCRKAQVKGYSHCAAGWMSDYNGYYMAETTAGCGIAGFNNWGTGTSGAYCCENVEYIGGYDYDSREKSEKACLSNTGKRLCTKSEVEGFSHCAAGWMSDYQGYYMRNTVDGCGKADFNSWHGASGAFCCPY